jgi:ferritin
MSALFAELAHVDTAMGELTLRRRREPRRQVDVYEVKLGDEYLMSSLFTVAEIALARLGLARLDREPLTVVVGGLGLGYTAEAVLEDPRVAELLVVEALEPVIDWHEAGLLPVSGALTGDDRCHLVVGDFFALARGEVGFDEREPGRRVDAILMDADLQARFNAQIALEHAAERAYLQMAAWAEAHDYNGSAAWLRSQAAEEGEHARLFMDHVLDRGGEVTLAALAAPRADFDDLLAVFVAALEHERKVTASIGDLYAAATDARAYPSLPLLTWFLEEQVEEEASVGTVVGELRPGHRGPQRRPHAGP